MNAKVALFVALCGALVVAQQPPTPANCATKNPVATLEANQPRFSNEMAAACRTKWPAGSAELTTCNGVVNQIMLVAANTQDLAQILVDTLPILRTYAGQSIERLTFLKSTPITQPGGAAWGSLYQLFICLRTDALCTWTGPAITSNPPQNAPLAISIEFACSTTANATERTACITAKNSVVTRITNAGTNAEKAKDISDILLQYAGSDPQRILLLKNTPVLLLPNPFTDEVLMSFVSCGNRANCNVLRLSTVVDPRNDESYATRMIQKGCTLEQVAAADCNRAIDRFKKCVQGQKVNFYPINERTVMERAKTTFTEAQLATGYPNAVLDTWGSVNQFMDCTF